MVELCKNGLWLRLIASSIFRDPAENKTIQLKIDRILWKVFKSYAAGQDISGSNAKQC